MIRTTEFGRIFIDITEEGCPCGCVYCFVKTGKEVLLDESAIDSLAERLNAHPSFVAGPHGTLLSFGSHCDLFRTPKLANRFFAALEKVTPFGNPIQVSTKQYVNQDWAYHISHLRAFTRQIVIFVSCATVTQSSLYEPLTAHPTQRFASFEVLRAFEIPSCLFIKPFIPGVTDKDTLEFIDVAKAHQPDAVCVGTLYLNSEIAQKLLVPIEGVKGGRQHPLATDLSAAAPPDPGFMNALRSATPHTPVFMSSACVVAYVQRVSCATLVWRVVPQLCVSCQDCETLCLKAPRRGGAICDTDVIKQAPSARD